jgi:hypothetical protein
MVCEAVIKVDIYGGLSDNFESLGSVIFWT